MNAFTEACLVTVAITTAVLIAGILLESRQRRRAVKKVIADVRARGSRQAYFAKGGYNETFQISDRPPPPAPMGRDER